MATRNNGRGLFMRTDLKHILRPENGPSLRTKLWWLSWNNYQSPLPTKGFLAGGAVASLVLSEAWGGNFPINDLDVFLTDSEKTDPPATPVRITGIALDNQVEDDEYQGRYNVRNRGYQVVNSDRIDLINTVSVRMLEDELPVLAAYRFILQGFDLNCCQIGIDLESDQLIWTPEFEEFVATGQLKVTHLATPYHTAIRLAKKQGELNCYCDLKTELSLLTTYVDMVSALGRSNRNNVMYSRFFGKKYHETYLCHQNSLEPYCIVFPGTNQLLLPGTGIPTPDYYSMELNVPSAYQELRPYFYIYGGLQLSSVSMLQMFDKICRPTTRSVTRRKFVTAIKLGGLAAICAIQNSGFLDCNHHHKNFKKLEQFAREHFGVICLFNRLGLNFSEQLQAIRTIGCSVKKHGLFVIGLLEDSNNVILREATELSEELIEHVVSDFRRSVSATQLVSPVNLSGFPRKHLAIVIELVNAQQLEEEGIKQHHCVGGYIDAIQSGKCRIFHLEYLGESTTLQILRSGKCGEHRARFNRLPPPEHVTLAAELSDYIHMLNSDVEADYGQALLDSMPYHGGDINDIVNQIEA